MYNDRDLQVARRDAFVEGASYGVDWYFAAKPFESPVHAAVRRYPLPKVERPRTVVNAFGTKFRIEDGVLQYKPGISNFYSTVLSVYIEDILLVADLLSRPTELVEDDGTE